MKNKLLQRVMAFALLFIFLGWMIYYIRNHLQDFAAITDVPLSTLLMLYPLFIGMVVCNGLTVKYILSAFGITLHIREWFSLSAVSALANYMTLFRGGAGLRALYLKAKYKFSFSDFLSTLSAMYLIYFMVTSVIGLLGMLLLFYDGIAFDLALSGLFAILFVFSSTAMLVRIRLPEFNVFPLREIARIINGWDMIRTKKNLLVKLITNNICYICLIILQTKVAFSNYDVNMSWGAAFFFSAAKSLALLLTITPGSIGIVEWLSVYMGATLAYSVSEALMAQALMRMVTITTLIIIGPFAARYLNKKIFVEKKITGKES